jgi:phage protein U
LGREPASQYIGPGEETISLDGDIYPTYKGGLGQLDSMREMAGTGTPMLLVDGLGRILRKWVITQIEEDQGTFLEAGIPRKVSFTMSLKRYGEDT